jgi:hypothetical protein
MYIILSLKHACNFELRFQNRDHINTSIRKDSENKQLIGRKLDLESKHAITISTIWKGYARLSSWDTVYS